MQSTMTAPHANPAAPKPDDRAGKYLTFLIGKEEFGVGVLKVREIMGIQDITAMPQTPPYMKGVINLRGKVIPVIDLRLKFGLPSIDYTERTCIIVVQVRGGTGVSADGNRSGRSFRGAHDGRGRNRRHSRFWLECRHRLYSWHGQDQGQSKNPA